MTDMTPERIYLVPDDDGYSWCEDPAPGIGMEAADAVEYVRADTLAPKRVAGDMTPEQALIMDLRNRLLNETANPVCCGQYDDDPNGGPLCCGKPEADIPEDVAALVARADEALSRPAVPEVTDDMALVRNAQALLDLEAKGALVPHGSVGHARDIIAAFIARMTPAPAVPEGWRKAMKRLVLVARTTGGTAGPDADLMAACAVCEDMLAAAPAEESSGDHFRDATKMVEGEERTTPEDALVWNGSALSAVRSESGLMRHLSKCAARVAQWPDWKRKAMESAEGDSE